MANLIILSKYVTRESRGFMFGITCACGAFGAVIALTLGQLIHDKINYETLFVCKILATLFYIIFFHWTGGESQFIPRTKIV